MHAGQCNHEGQFADKVTVARTIEAVGRHGREAERVFHMVTVDRQGRAGERPRAERQHVGAFAAVGQPLTVALEFLAPGEQLMRCQHRLRPPHVGVAGNDQPLLADGEAKERPPDRCGSALCAACGRRHPSGR